jgi:DNA-directed RNA polymerase subunit RPC12/RpoP
MIDDKVKIICFKCSMMFRERAQRIRNGLQMRCPHCFKLLTFDSGTDDRNIRRAIRNARDVRITLEATRPKVPT